MTETSALQQRVRRWLMNEKISRPDWESSGKYIAEEPKKHSWWQVMCLSGLDYFSTLGYQPAIAVLAAGMIAPIATLILIVVTLFAALPVYRRVAEESPHGQGSISMLERLMPRWNGKLFVLVLLGFAATDYMITITLSSADASAHIIENPFTPEWFTGLNVPITLVLLVLLTLLFLRGFEEVIGLSVALVGAYLILNAIVIVVSLMNVLQNPTPVGDWWTALTSTHTSWGMVAVALLVFPKLALGLSGFETGVAVMPQVKNGVGDTEENPAGRIAGTKRLLTAAALLMSIFLMSSSLVTTWLIPMHEFEAGGEANGRALAFLAHQELGDVFGTVYDLSTIGILWFAGASALAGMLNLIPRYLPRFGMAPEWARANRPLVLVLAVIAVAITLFFDANVDAQGAAYATGVLVLMTSAAIAVMLSAKRRHQKAAFVYFALVVLVFLYTTVANVIERPDGIRIAALFILGIVLVSFLSRFRRSLELRATSVTLDEEAKALIAATASNGRVKVIAHEAKLQSEARYRAKYQHARYAHQFAEDENKVIFLEISVGDSSDFAQDILVRGKVRYGFPVLEASGSAVPTAIAAVSLQIRDEMGIMPHIYFRWTEGNPVKNLLRFLFLGQGEIAPVTREVLREAVPDITQRPWIHVS